MPQAPVFGRIPTYDELDAINTNLQGYWRFQGDATDEDATGSDLSVTSGETFAHASLAEGIEGAWIGGNTERRAYDRTTIDASLQIDGDLTIACLFTLVRAQNPDADHGIVLCECATNSESGTSVFADPGFGVGLRYSLCIVDESYVGVSFSNGAGDGDIYDFSFEARVPVGVPTHIALRRSGTTVEVYLNGQLVATDTLATGTGNGNGTTLTVGRSLDTARNFAGAIAGLAIWDAALTAAEIKEVYQEYLVKGTRSDLAGGTDIDFKGDATEYHDTLTANRTLTFSNPVQGEVIMLQLTQDMGGGNTLTLPGTATIVSGTFSTTGSAVNHVAIMCIDESTPKYIVAIAQE